MKEEEEEEKMKLNEKEETTFKYDPGKNALILHRDSIFIWIFALPFFAVGLLFIAMPWGLASNSDQVPLWGRFLCSAMGMFSTLTALVLWRAGLDEVILDRSRNRLVFCKRFSGRITRTIACEEVADVVLETTKDSDGDTAYRVVLKLVNGKQVPVNRNLVTSRELADEDRARIKHQIKHPFDIYPRGSLAKRKAPPFITFELDDENPAKPGRKSLVVSDPKPLIELLVTLTVVVIVGPFAGWWLAALEKPALALQVGHGKPDAKLARELHFRGVSKMAPEEEILFVATPEPGHEGLKKIWFLPFAMVWTLFSLFWTACAVSAAVSSKNFMAWFMVLWGLPFVGIGAVMLATPYVTYKRELHTIYAITDKRTLSFTNEGVQELVSFDDRRFGPIEATNYSKTRTDLLFRKSLDPESPGVTSGFWGIEGGAEAQAILEAKLKEAQGR
ncbi:MAG: hypothetical protein IPK73_25390 [Candidatus Obscuribacter sp.]|nr:hypothetical protein [Candidatus Obscuribacter sp.]MBK9277455.1 hypothetical protein [Candidatus Obscuribacter sp.]